MNSAKGFVLSYQKNGNSTGDTADTMKAKLTDAFAKVGVQLQDSEMQVVALPQAAYAMEAPEQGIWISQAKVAQVHEAAKSKQVPVGAINAHAQPLGYNIGLMAMQLAQQARSTAMGAA